MREAILLGTSSFCTALVVSTDLLIHDCGKPISAQRPNRLFHLGLTLCIARALSRQNRPVLGWG